MPRVKIVAVGAASASFGVAILRDFLGCGDFQGSHLALVDTNERGLELMHRVARRIVEATAADAAVSAATDAAEVLEDADYVLISVAVARLEGWRMDWEVPLAHGLRHAMAENAGVGGMLQLMRNLPPALDVALKVQRLCPEALVINFSNPLPRMVYALREYGGVGVIGLCHGLEIARERFSRWLDVPREEVELRAAGVNHLTWVLDARRRGAGDDLYGPFRELCLSGRAPDEDRLCQRLLQRFGHWPTCGDMHSAEFLPWRMVDEVYPFPEEPPGDWPHAYPAERRGRPYGWVGPPWRFDWEASAQQRQQTRRWLERIADGAEPVEQLLGAPSGEYARDIIVAVETARPWLCPAVNVPNDGYIENLPDGAVVEVPAVVDGAGIHPLKVGRLADGPAYFCAAQAHIQPLAARAAAIGDVAAALQAISIEPSVGCMEAAEAAFRELVWRQRQWLPQLAGAG